jgi:hypothetical protein
VIFARQADPLSILREYSTDRDKRKCFMPERGGMAERLIAVVLKTI